MNQCKYYNNQYELKYLIIIIETIGLTIKITKLLLFRIKQWIFVHKKKRVVKNLLKEKV